MTQEQYNNIIGTLGVITGLLQRIAIDIETGGGTDLTAQADAKAAYGSQAFLGKTSKDAKQ